MVVVVDGQGDGRQQCLRPLMQCHVQVAPPVLLGRESFRFMLIHGTIRPRRCNAWHAVQLRPPSLAAEAEQPLVGVFLEEDGQQVVHYFADEAAADAAAADHALTRALTAIGSWSDLDWDETAEALDRIRHERTPTPPIEL